MSRRTREYLDKLMNDLMSPTARPPDDLVASEEATQRAQELLAKRIHDGTATPDEYLAGTAFAAAAVAERHHRYRGYRSGEPWELPPTAADALHEFCLVVLWETVRELQNTNEQGEKTLAAG